jgi:hypothetical protein
MRRLQKAEEWLRRLCVSLLQESGWELPASALAKNYPPLLSKTDPGSLN